jgi:hypothetical protein
MHDNPWRELFALGQELLLRCGRQPPRRRRLRPSVRKRKLRNVRLTHRSGRLKLGARRWEHEARRKEEQAQWKEKARRREEEFRRKEEDAW